jgi:hypothetical protein
MTTIREVEKALSTVTPSHSALFYGLLHSRKNNTYKSIKTLELRKSEGWEASMPQLGRRLSPFPNLPSVDNIRDILLDALDAHTEAELLKTNAAAEASDHRDDERAGSPDRSRSDSSFDVPQSTAISDSHVEGPEAALVPKATKSTPQSKFAATPGSEEVSSEEPSWIKNNRARIGTYDLRLLTGPARQTPKNHLLRRRERARRSISETTPQPSPNQSPLSETTAPPPNFLYYPPQETRSEDLQAARLLVQNITNRSFPSPSPDGYISILKSAKLSALATDIKKDLPGQIYVSEPVYRLFPSKHVIQLQHQHSCSSYVTQLSGSIIWVVWPPTESDLSALAKAYAEYDNDMDKNKLNEKAGDLEGGVMFVTERGDAFRIPSFCPLMGVVRSRETSVLATYSVTATADLLNVGVGKNVELLKAWWGTDFSHTSREAAQFALGSSVARDISSILHGDMDRLPDANSSEKVKHPWTEEGPLLEVLTRWDEVRVELVGIMDGETRGAFMRAWVSLLEEDGERCLICGTEYGSGEEGEEMVEHFERWHWMSREEGGRRAKAMAKLALQRMNDGERQVARDVEMMDQDS